MRKGGTERKRVAERLVSPFAEFAHQEASSGLVLMACTLVAVVLANSSLAASYFDLWQTPITFGAGESAAGGSLLYWINDGLMTIFFLLVGMEIKRELVVGQLASVRRAALPVFAAVGGMLLPAIIYSALNWGGGGSKGWGIPMATDIAFALGVLALLGDRIPLSLKIFLAAIAIVDDIGAVLVIAIFYSGHLNPVALAAAGGFFLALIAMNRLEVRSMLVYGLLGIGLWVAILNSGVHATIAGVLLAFTIPAKVHLRPTEFVEEVEASMAEFKQGDSGATVVLTEERQTAMRQVEKACEQAQMPLERLSNRIELWVAFLIVPLFALANAGVPLVDASVIWREPVGIGVAVGLLLGKPLGITAFSYIAVKLGLADLPREICWRQVIGAGVLGGVGFTMSLFITELAFTDQALVQSAKVAILAASVAAGLLGFALLFKSNSVCPPTEPA